VIQCAGKFVLKTNTSSKCSFN